VEPAYATTIAVARVMFRALGLRCRIEGGHHIPRSGPVVIASNHISFLDFTLVGLAARASGRRPRFLARHEVWDNRVAGPFMRAMRHVPVDTSVPAAAYLQARALLRDGEAVAIFPEAGVSTSYTVRALMPGAVALAAETGAPLVPMVIWGPHRIATAHQPVQIRRGRPVSILVGEPYVVPPDADPISGTLALGTRLQAMLDELQARPVHQPRPGETPRWHPAHLGGSAPTVVRAREIETTVPRRALGPTWMPGYQ
jgi:1-acyl-sn-glycerol-3-phosphate acyltransferase